MKHTQGKWIVSKNNIGLAVMVFNGKRVTNICNLIVLKDSIPVKKGEHEANAKLIAAAPEMLKTLNTLKSAVFNHGQNIKKIDPVELYHQISLVIKTATGSNL